ncbi:ROK family transcriptional regulator [Rheinheimera texasensis]|uniref:ROK family transcriptional regulator n=1 Tax=Rheinheimera texasensis TaxID=306205 RepID=UPI0032B15A63
MRTGANAEMLGDLNARLLLGAVRRRMLASRPELADELGLSLQAVTRIVAGLCRDGLLQPCGKKTLGVGQPTQFYQLVPDVVFSIGIQLQRTQLQLVLTDFCGNILRRQHCALDSWSPQRVQTALLQQSRQLLAQLSASQQERLCGIGLAMPWFAGNSQFAARLYPQLDATALQQLQQAWQDVDLAADLQHELKIPVYPENDGSAAAAAELWLGKPAAADFLYLYLDQLPAGGLVLNGQLWRGRHGNAAHLAVLPVSNGQLLLQQPDAHNISNGLQAVMALLDIPLLIIDSSKINDLTPLLADIRQQLELWPALGLLVPQLQQGSLGSDAMLLGAAMLPLYQAYAPDRTVL